MVLDEKGRILSVAPRERLDAHRLVEDYMIAANVAAAKALEAKKAPVMYRVHEAPGREKLVALKDYLATFDVEFALGQVIRPAIFNRIIERFGDREGRQEIMEQVLRTQMQARYSPDPLGHFGLALPTYAHFTSPIRRYADLVVHRALTRSYKLGEGGLTDHEAEASRSSASTSRCSNAARWRPSARRSTAMSPPSSPTRSGRSSAAGSPASSRSASSPRSRTLGGDGLVLAADLGNEYFRYDEKARDADRRRERRNLSRRPASRAAAGRGQSRLRRRCASSFRKAATAARRGRAATGFAPARGAKPPPRRGRPGQYPPPGKRR